MLVAASLVAGLPAAEVERIRVYVIAAAIGLLVFGLVSLAKKRRREPARASNRRRP